MNNTPALLIVDNDTTLSHLLARNFTKQGYSVTTAECPQEAIVIAKTQAFDAAMLDGRLPDCDGVRLMQELQYHLPGLPTIVLSAHADAEFRERCLSNGAFAYSRKPSSLNDIESTVASAVHIGSGTRQEFQDRSVSRQSPTGLESAGFLHRSTLRHRRQWSG